MALCCHLSPVRLDNTLPHYPINGMIFGKKKTNLVWNISHSKKNPVRWSQIIVGLHVQWRYYCQVVMKTKFSRQIFEKYSNIELCGNHFSGSGVVPRWHTDVSKLIVAFRDLVNAPKTCKYEELSNYARYVSSSAFWYYLRVTHKAVGGVTRVQAAQPKFRLLSPLSLLRIGHIGSFPVDILAGKCP